MATFTPEIIKTDKSGAEVVCFSPSLPTDIIGIRLDEYIRLKEIEWRYNSVKELNIGTYMSDAERLMFGFPKEDDE